MHKKTVQEIGFRALANYLTVMIAALIASALSYLLAMLTVRFHLPDGVFHVISFMIILPTFFFMLTHQWGEKAAASVFPKIKTIGTDGEIRSVKTNATPLLRSQNAKIMAAVAQWDKAAHELVGRLRKSEAEIKEAFALRESLYGELVSWSELPLPAPVSFEQIQDQVAYGSHLLEIINHNQTQLNAIDAQIDPLITRLDPEWWHHIRNNVREIERSTVSAWSTWWEFRQFQHRVDVQQKAHKKTKEEVRQWLLSPFSKEIYDDLWNRDQALIAQLRNRGHLITRDGRQYSFAFSNIGLVENKIEPRDEDHLP